MDGDAKGNTLHEIYHTGIRNLHALEQTAIELTERQVERLEHYPEMKARLATHHTESREQSRRLEAIMTRHQIEPNTLKTSAASMLGNVAAALHVAPQDEILKNIFANFAFEHQEIAAYTSLIEMAEQIGDTASIATLKQSLAEEEAMAEFIRGQIVPTTARFIALTRAGVVAGK